MQPLLDENSPTEMVGSSASKWQRLRQKSTHRKIGRVNCGSAMKVVTVWFGTRAGDDVVADETTRKVL